MVLTTRIDVILVYNDTKTIAAAIQKTQPFSVEVAESDTVGTLEGLVKSHLGNFKRVAMVCKGSVLKDMQERLSKTDVLSTKKVFVVKLKEKRKRKATTAPSEPQGLRRRFVGNIPSESGATNEIVESGERVCRICLESKETRVTGRLFAPCICKGSMKFVHIKCLNEWRAVAVGTKNFYECPQCKFNYKIERTPLADFFEDDRLAITVALLAFTLALFLLGLLFEQWPLDFICPKILTILNYRPDAAEFLIARKSCHGRYAFEALPEEYDCNTTCNSWFGECPSNICVCELEGRIFLRWSAQRIFHGSMVMGIIGIIFNLKYDRALRDMLLRQWMRILIICAMGSTVAYLRHFIIIFGVGHTFYKLLNKLRITAKRLMILFGHRILDYVQ